MKNCNCMKIFIIFLVGVQVWSGPVSSDKENPAVGEARADPSSVVKAPGALENPEGSAPTLSKPEEITEAEAPGDEPEEAESTTKDFRPEGRSANGIIDNDIHAVTQREVALLQKLNKKCRSSDIPSCVMLKMLTYMNRLLKKSSIQVTDGLEITQTSAVVEEDIPEGTARDAKGEPNDVSQLSHLVTNKMWTFLKSRSLRWNVLPDADVLLSTNPDGEGTLNVGISLRAGRALGGGRKKNNFGPLLAAGIMKLGLIGGVAFKALALLVGKAIILSKIAFMLGAILWLKKLFSHNRHVTYEVVAHPHHSHSHVSSDIHSHHPDSYSSGWGRNLEVDVVADSTDAAGKAQDLAYRAHVPQ